MDYQRNVLFAESKFAILLLKNNSANSFGGKLKYEIRQKEKCNYTKLHLCFIKRRIIYILAYKMHFINLEILKLMKVFNFSYYFVNDHFRKTFLSKIKKNLVRNISAKLTPISSLLLFKSQLNFI